MLEAMSTPHDLAQLLAQTGWTRSLARRLASDAHLADDLVQDAWVAALERPPELGAPVRGWIASVLRHRWLDLRRARARRLARERVAAAEEAWPSAHDVVEKASLQRALVEAVLELEEPCRTAILLRFFEELPQREIARRTGTTVATVNSRLTRGLARLRQRLSRGGGRAAWLRVLVPLLGRPRAAPALFLGAGAMKAIVSSVLVAAALVAGLALWLAQATEPAPRAQRPALAAAAPSPAAPAPGLAASPLAPSAERVPLGVEAPAAPAPPALAPEPASPRSVLGRVIDATGAPLSGIPLAAASDLARCVGTSAAGGWFEVAVEPAVEAIVAADPRFVTVLAGSARVLAPTRTTVVVAPRLALAGRVEDEAGAALADASLELRLPAGFGAAWGFALDYSLPQRWRARSAPDGRFALDAAPAVPGIALHAALAGYAPHAAELALQSSDALAVVLARPRGAAGLVQGIVLDPAGERAEGARVSAGEEIARTDERGRFALRVPRGPGAARLLALLPGFLPAVHEPERDADGAPLWPEDVVLQLRGPAGALAGRVVDADGRPVVGAKVWLRDPTPFGKSGETRLVAESLLRGDERFWSFVLSDADGAFALGGLLDRPYRLQAIDPRTLASVTSDRLRAEDAPVELRLPTDGVQARVAGRVVTSAGQPIAGVSVRLLRTTFELDHEHGTDNEAQESEPVLTGADGAFAFRGVVRQGVLALAAGDTILAAAASLEDEQDLERIEIVASLRLHLQVELDEPHGRADRLEVLDAGGRPVPLRVFRGPGSDADHAMPILAGRSAVLSVDERAAELVLLRGAERVGRVPLYLTPGATNVVRW